MHYTLCDFILDLFQNSVEAGADTIRLDLIEEKDHFHVYLEDDGKGMSEEELAKARDPFYTDGIKHKHRKVGLGIPFLLQTLEMTEGTVNITSEKGKGTVLDIVFNTGHWDTPPVGDIVLMLFQALIFSEDYEAVIHRENREMGIGFDLKRSELIEVLGSLNDAGNMGLLKDYIHSQEHEKE